MSKYIKIDDLHLHFKNLVLDGGKLDSKTVRLIITTLREIPIYEFDCELATERKTTKMSSICDHCATVGCIFQAGIEREKCAFYKNKSEEAIKYLEQILIDILRMTPNKDIQAILLETYIQDHGAISDENGEIVRQILMEQGGDDNG